MTGDISSIFHSRATLGQPRVRPTTGTSIEGLVVYAFRPRFGIIRTREFVRLSITPAHFRCCPGSLALPCIQGSACSSRLANQLWNLPSPFSPFPSARFVTHRKSRANERTRCDEIQPPPRTQNEPTLASPVCFI